MFDSLIDNLNSDKWQEIDASTKVESEWKEYHVNLHHKQLNDTTIGLMIAVDDGELKNVELKDCLPKKDALKQIGTIEIKLNAEETEIVGLDLNGDVVVRK
ncbi:uncharacterized protein LOC123553731 [Mercenaria mercenaria]|uniref:uncharacterized protein LOC123553731 n=1 Tax=Mercenaria mercenaria TaxID=6596 RepID=UPI00234F7AB5|nr:uncharacterized protein LOC123553731 [Mercenaria mercenaria]XP_053404847.1 uncharacterized protein LOC123553731 [Mercenaria mercenaria]